MRIAPLFAVVVALCCSVALADYTDREDVEAYIDELVAEHGFQRDALQRIFSEAEYQQPIIDSISRPAERVLEWHEYREIFLGSDRIEQGLAFWRKHRDALERAEGVYGVPAEIIVATLGVETRFGRNKGSWRVIDALSTLAFDYPARSDFFRRELTEFLLLTREEGLEPISLEGSYAGAMGYGQFIPSSFRAYAVDFDGDGVRDIWNSTSDAIGSVANYYQRHGWQPRGDVVKRAEVTTAAGEQLVQEGLRLSRTVGELRDAGVALKDSSRLADDEPAALLRKQGEHGVEYWLALHNFRVITRYNRSNMYALVVHQLGEAILDAYDEADDSSAVARES